MASAWDEEIDADFLWKVRGMLRRGQRPVALHGMDPDSPYRPQIVTPDRAIEMVGPISPGLGEFLRVNGTPTFENESELPNPHWFDWRLLGEQFEVRIGYIEDGRPVAMIMFTLDLTKRDMTCTNYDSDVVQTQPNYW